MFDTKAVILMVVMCIITAGAVRYFTPEKIDYRVPADVEQKLDSVTTLNRSLRIDKSQLEDSLEGTSQAFAEYVQENRDQLVAYNRIIGTLKLQVDSLQQASSLSLFDIRTDSSDTTGRQFEDTIMEKSSTFGDSLMMATARGGIRNDSLFLDPPEIRQLRPVRIDQAQFVHDDGRTVEALTTSQDFQNLKVVSVTTVGEAKKFPWKWVFLAAGFIAGSQL